MSGVGTTGLARQEPVSSMTRLPVREGQSPWATPWWWPGRRWNRRRAEAGEEIAMLNMKHSAECKAIDLLCEVDRIENTVELCEEATFAWVCLYLQGVSNFAAT
eukprot:9080707-Heterocapsa_arctica.AAC.1